MDAGLSPRGKDATCAADSLTTVLPLRYHLLEDNCLLMLLDRDTRRGPRTRVLVVITRRSAHYSLLRTHKPWSPLLLCPARTPVPLAQVLTHCRLLPFKELPPVPQVHGPLLNLGIPNLDP